MFYNLGSDFVCIDAEKDSTAAKAGLDTFVISVRRTVTR